jgi:multidrug efflux pump subunit AcrB
VYRLALRYRAVTIALVLAITAVLGGMVISGRVAFVLLPEEDGQVLRARVRFPEGTPLSTTEAAVSRIEAAARALNDDPSLTPAAAGVLVRQVYSVTGEFTDFLVSTGNNLCEVRIELMPAEDRRISDERIMTAWRSGIGTMDDAVSYTVSRLMPGPIESPVEVRLLGDDLDALTNAADEVERQLGTYKGVAEVFRDLVPGQRELHIDLKPQARALGLTLADVATQLRQGFFGGEAVRVHRGAEEVVVRVRYPLEERRSVAELESKRFRTLRGDEIPFSEAVEVEWTRGWAEILHQDGHRRVRVYANLDESTANAEQIIQDMERTFLPDLAARYDGLRYHFGGNRQAMTRSVTTLLDGFKVAIIAIYAVLAGMLRSYFQPIVIIATVPLGLIGAVLGHMILGYDVTLMSLFGLVALSGVIVNDALVLVDRINVSIREGDPVFAAVLAAGELRFRAVILTTITTIAGLTPLLAERSTQAYAVKPMAISLVFGELFGTALTLIVVPVFFLVVNDVRRFAYWLRYGGGYPRREIVEEAARERLLGAK